MNLQATDKLSSFFNEEIFWEYLHYIQFFLHLMQVKSCFLF